MWGIYVVFRANLYIMIETRKLLTTEAVSIKGAQILMNLLHGGDMESLCNCSWNRTRGLPFLEI